MVESRDRIEQQMEMDEHGPPEPDTSGCFFFIFVVIGIILYAWLS